MAQDTTYVELKIGEETETPGLQFKVEFAIGGNELQAKTAAIAEQIGGFEKLKLYAVLQATSSESAHELATFLTSAWAALSSGIEVESALAALVPLLKPDPEGEALANFSFIAHNDKVVVTVEPNEQLNFQAEAVAELGFEQVSALLESEQGFKLEIDFGASVSDLVHSANPALELFKSFKTRFDLAIQTGGLAHLEPILGSAGPQALYALKLATLYKSAHLAVAFRSPSELPASIRDQIQSSGEVFQQAFAFVQQIPPADRRVLDKLAEHTTGQIDLYAHFKGLLKVHIIAKGASVLLEGNN